MFKGFGQNFKGFVQYKEYIDFALEMEKRIDFSIKGLT